MQNAGPRQPNRHERYILHMPRQNGVHIHLRWCPSTSHNLLFVPVRSGRSVLPNKKKGCNTSSSSSYVDILFFLGLHRIYSFPTTNQHQLMRQIIFHSVRSNALWGGLRHTLNSGLLCRTCSLVRPGGTSTPQHRTSRRRSGRVPPRPSTAPAPALAAPGPPSVAPSGRCRRQMPFW